MLTTAAIITLLCGFALLTFFLLWARKEAKKTHREYTKKEKRRIKKDGI